MKKILAIAFILLLLASNSLGAPEHSRKPETINIPPGFSNCHIKTINLTTTPPTIKCVIFDYQI